jgi:hypothetical protein
MKSMLCTDSFFNGAYNALTFSSENASFPAANLWNYARQSKVWRSSSVGNWDVTASNNSIIFYETNAVPLTATIAVGVYTATTLATAIKSAMEAVGDSTYTVQRDGGNTLWNITSNLAGGGNIFKLGTSSGLVMLGFDTARSTSASTHTADKLMIHTSEWFKVDMGQSINAKAFILFAKDRPANLTSNAVIKLQASHTDVWTTPAFEVELDASDLVVATFDTAGIADDEYRFWRIEIIDPSNPQKYIEFSKMYLGDAYAPVRGAIKYPLRISSVEQSEIFYTESGDIFSNPGAKSEEYTLEYWGLTTTDKEGLADALSEGLAQPVFVILDPDGVFSTDATDFIRLSRLVRPVVYTLESPNNYSADVVLGGVK